VTSIVEGTIIDELKAFVGDFGAMVSSSLAVVKTMVDIEVGLRDKAGVV
jgi:hypothetical protein